MTSTIFTDLTVSKAPERKLPRFRRQRFDAMAAQTASALFSTRYVEEEHDEEAHVGARAYAVGMKAIRLVRMLTDPAGSTAPQVREIWFANATEWRGPITPFYVQRERRFEPIGTALMNLGTLEEADPVVCEWPVPDTGVVLVRPPKLPVSVPIPLHLFHSVEAIVQEHASRVPGFALSLDRATDPEEPGWEELVFRVRTALRQDEAFALSDEIAEDLERLLDSLPLDEQRILARNINIDVSWSATQAGDV